MLCAAHDCCLCAEMNYDAATDDEPAGEVLLRGPQLFSGYYKQVGRPLGVRFLNTVCVSEQRTTFRVCMSVCVAKGLRGLVRGVRS